MIKKLPLREYRKIYRRVPRLAVELALFARGGVVLTKRTISPGEGQWHMPGGTVLLGETLRQAAARVIKEELGISVRVGKVLGIIEYRRLSGNFGQPISIVFVANPRSLNFHLNSQASAVQIFQTLPRNLLADHRRFLKHHRTAAAKGIKPETHEGNEI